MPNFRRNRSEVLSLQSRIDRSLAALPPRQLEQIRLYETLPGYGELFFPMAPNNFVFIAVPRISQLGEVLDRVRSGVKPLNVANESLFQFCNTSFSDLKTNAAIQSALADWQELIQNNKNLLCVRVAARFAQALRSSSGLDLGECLQERDPEILKRFIAATPYIKASCRVNICLDFQGLQPAFENLTGLLVRNPELRPLIERVELGIDFGPQKTPGGISFPTLIIYLSGAAKSSKNHFLLKLLCTHLCGLGQTENHYPGSINPEYAGAVNNSTTVTQGFKLYKQYLHVLGLIDRIYDKLHNYAFIDERQTGAGEAWFTDTLKSGALFHHEHASV